MTDPGGERESVGIVILNHNAWQDTLACLESVFRLDGPDFRVVVCDNASTDGSMERICQWALGELEATTPTDQRLAILTTPPVHKPIDLLRLRGVEVASDGPRSPLTLIETGENRGFAAGNNVGMRHLLADPEIEFIWILNNDVVVAPDALRALVEEARENPSAGITGSKVMHFDRPDIIQAAGGGLIGRWTGLSFHLGRDEPDVGQWEDSIPPDYVTGCSLLARADMIRDIGAMDETYFVYSEEVDWCLRARRHGWDLGYAAASRIWHREGATSGRKSPFSDYHSLRGVLRLTRRYRPWRLPGVFLYSLWRFLLPKIVRRQPERLRATLAAYRDFLTGRETTGPQPWKRHVQER
jgi:GT2 family glycosyltransferase